MARCWKVSFGTPMMVPQELLWSGLDDTADRNRENNPLAATTPLIAKLLATPGIPRGLVREHCAYMATQPPLWQCPSSTRQET
jgi:hypothetical protein